MKAARWRVLLLGICGIVALLAIVDIFLEYAGPHSTSTVGQWGDTLAASAQPYHLAVLSIDPGHGADLAGLRPGDLIDIRANAPVERFWLFGQPPTGRAVTILARRGAQTHRFTIVPQTILPLRRLILTPIWLGFLWIALFAAVIAWRGSGDAQMRALSLLLVSYALWETTNQHYISSESVWLLILAAGANVFGTITVAFWAACAGSFGPARSRLRRAAQWLCYALIGTTIAVGILKIVGIATLQVDPIAFGSSASAVPFVLGCLAATGCTILAVRATQGAERQRAVWALVPAAVLIFVGFSAESAQGVVKSYELAWAFTTSRAP